MSGWRPFGRWAATPLDLDDEFLQDDYPCVIDVSSQQKDPVPIADGIRLTQAKLQGSGSAVRITGLSGVGKTRFAQALFETNVCKNALPTADVIYADLGDDLIPTASELISYLIANDFTAYVVLDNCPPDVHRRLQQKISLQQAKLSLLTIEYDISDDRPEETLVVHLEPSSEGTVSRLIQKRFPALGCLNADKVSEFSGGNARIAIALACRVEADETLTNFSDEELFQRLFYQRKRMVDSLIESAEVFSLVYSFNVSKSEFNDELGVLAAMCGLERRTLNRSHAELLRRQLSQRRGNWRAILPHALANRLARRALQNIPYDEINAELLKPENLRLFQSCAHRLGYLHDFEPARQLAETWMQPGKPLHDIASCGGEFLKILGYLAPVFPDKVLKAIEVASKDPVFSSRSNKHFLVFVRLLRRIAYDDDSFDRASALLLKFAETEKPDENNNSIVSELQKLFSLYLSGTQATPKRRQRFVQGLFTASNSRHMEIAYELFRSAFKAFHWTSTDTFDFGAHSRNYGWEPNTDKEKLDWYVGFIKLLKPHLAAKDEMLRRQAKELLAGHFRGLWVYAGCFEILEEVVKEHATSGSWPEMWLSIKRTIYFDGEKDVPALPTRLEALERLAAPLDLYSEIEAYVFTDTWEHIDVKRGNYEEESIAVHEKIIKLGELAASEPEYLEKLAPRLWVKDIDALLFFGKGLAKGNVDQVSTFEFLVQMMQKQKLEMVQPILFNGYIQGVHTENPSLVRQLQERVLEISELKPYFVYFLVAIPIAPWGIKKLQELACSEELDAWQYRQISYGHIYETIPDDDLFNILSSLNNLKGGIFSTIHILSRYFAADRGNTSGEKLRSVGRAAILKMLLTGSDDISRNESHGVNMVIKQCLSDTAPEKEIVKIVSALCGDLEFYHINGSEWEEVVKHVVKNFPEIVLSRVFSDNEDEQKLVSLFFEDRISFRGSSLDFVAVGRVVKWCEGNQCRIQKVAAIVSPYSPVGGSLPAYNSEQVALSSHIMALLDVAKNKTGIVETIYSRTWPTSWSGSCAEIVEIRSKAFAELLNHHSPEVRELAKTKLSLFEEQVLERREREAINHTQREQTFE